MELVIQTSAGLGDPSVGQHSWLFHGEELNDGLLIGGGVSFQKTRWRLCHQQLANPPPYRFLPHDSSLRGAFGSPLGHNANAFQKRTLFCGFKRVFRMVIRRK